MTLINHQKLAIWPSDRHEPGNLMAFWRWLTAEMALSAIGAGRIT